MVKACLFDLDGVVYSGGNIDDINFGNNVFEKFQRIFQRIAAFYEFIGRDTERNRRPFTYLGPYRKPTQVGG